MFKVAIPRYCPDCISHEEMEGPAVPRHWRKESAGISIIMIKKGGFAIFVGVARDCWEGGSVTLVRRDLAFACARPCC
jgi:hypothetical protein